MKYTVISLLALIPSVACAASLLCTFGVSRCLKSQGTEIPSKQVVELLDRCEDFTFRDLGNITLKMNSKDITNEQSSEGITPLVKAWYAFGSIYDSPLKFERKRNAEEISYMEIKRACRTLEIDFYDDSKWAN